MRLLIAAFAFFALAAPAGAAQIAVTTNLDTLNPMDGLCSLREAVDSANANVGGNGCTSGDLSQTDTLALVDATYTLSITGSGDDDNDDGDLDVRTGGPLVIEGNGATIRTIAGDRVLDVVDPGASLTLRHVTVTDGNARERDAGGGIHSVGKLGLFDSTVTGNLVQPSSPNFDGASGGGIYSSGALALTRTTVSNNIAGGGGPGVASAGFPGGSGGGIFSSGPTTILSSRVVNNFAGTGGRGDIGESGGPGGSGGGLAADFGGSVTISNSLFAGNRTGPGGDGGDSNGVGGNGGTGGNGGGVSTSRIATIAFSTLIDNDVRAGGAGGHAPLPGLQGPPGDAPAIDASATATLSRSITAGSCAGTVVDGGGNIASSGGCPGSITPAQLDAAGTPRAGSPAIDGAPAAGCPTTDLLGTARPQGVRCDIGAIEARAAALTFSRSAFAFPSVTASLGTRTLAVTVRNPGLAGLTVPLSVTGAGFRLAAESCPAELAGARSCAVTVAFAPTRAGRLAGTLRVGGRSLPLSGTALAPCVVPKLKRKTRKQARKALVRAHCTLGTVKRRGRGRPGRIRSSRPRAGSVLEAGAAVNVVVNRRRARPPR